MFWDGVAAIRAMYERGEKVEATDAFRTGVAGPEYRQVIDKSLPPGAFELAVADVDTFFQVELAALQQWHFTAEEATRIRQPVLAVVGTESAPIFHEGHERTQALVPTGGGTGSATGDARAPVHEPWCGCRRPGPFLRPSPAVRCLEVKERAAISGG